MIQKVDKGDQIVRKLFEITDTTMAHKILRVFNRANGKNAQMDDLGFDSALKKSRQSRRFFGVNNISNLLIGFTFFSLDGNSSVLERIAVEPLYQRQGIGKLLLTESIGKIVSENGIKSVEASVLPTKARIMFYGNCGFTDWEEKKLGESHINPNALVPISLIKKIKM